MIATLRREYRGWLARYLSHAGAQVPADARMALTTLIRLRGELIFRRDVAVRGPDERQALDALNAESLRLAVATIDIPALSDRLERFKRLSASNGHDVSLIVDEDARDRAIEEGRQLLWDRHCIEAQIEGARWYVAQRPDLSAAVTAALTAIATHCAPLDDAWRGTIVDFIVLNPYRRSLRRQYVPAARFWWWHLQSDCDLERIYDAVCHGRRATKHARTCPFCTDLHRRLAGAFGVIRAAAPVAEPEHPTTQSIVELFEGRADPATERAIEAHVAWCKSCRAELDALVQGELNECEEREPRARAVEERTTTAATMVQAVWISAHEPAAAFAHQEQDAWGIRGEEVYHDDELHITVGDEAGRVLVRLYPQNMAALESFAATDCASLDDLAAVETEPIPDRRQYDIGDTRDLANRSVQLSVRYNGRLILPPRLEFRVKPEGA